MKLRSAPRLVEQRTGLEITSCLPAEIDFI